MLCILGTPRTNTVTGQTYEAVGEFICPNCGDVSGILEFAPPVEEWWSITCHKCGSIVDKYGRYGNKKRFIPLNDTDLSEEDHEELDTLEHV